MAAVAKPVEARWDVDLSIYDEDSDTVEQDECLFYVATHQIKVYSVEQIMFMANEIVESFAERPRRAPKGVYITRIECTTSDGGVESSTTRHLDMSTYTTLKHTRTAINGWWTIDCIPRLADNLAVYHERSVAETMARRKRYFEDMREHIRLAKRSFSIMADQ